MVLGSAKEGGEKAPVVLAVLEPEGEEEEEEAPPASAVAVVNQESEYNKCNG